MARSSTPRGDVAKERILQYAVQIFSERGFDGFTTRELSARAKVNIAAINYYFGHKQGLYEAAVHEVHRRLKERGAEVLAQVTQPPDPEQLRSIIAVIYRAAQKEMSGLRLLTRQVLDEAHRSSQEEAPSFLTSNEPMIEVLCASLRVSAERARTNLVAFGLLLSRYVIQDERSLVTAFGAKNAEEAEARIVDTLLATLEGGEESEC